MNEREQEMDRNQGFFRRKESFRDSRKSKSVVEEVHFLGTFV